MENKCLCRTCVNQDKNGYCKKMQDDCSRKCANGYDCNGMTVCCFYDSGKGD